MSDLVFSESLNILECSIDADNYVTLILRHIPTSRIINIQLHLNATDDPHDILDETSVNVMDIETSNNLVR